MVARLAVLCALSAILIVACGGGDKNKPPARTARTAGCTGSGYYALTFDDGPNPTYTPQVEAELDKLGVKATFFLVGQKVDAAPEFAKSLVKAGDWVGNHTFSHPNLTKLSAAEVRDELSRANRAIQDATGVRPEFVRPTYGDFNDQTVSVFKELNLENAMWTVDPKDWEAGRSVSEIVADAVKVQDGGIILLHDTNERTVAALPEIVNQLKQKGLCPGKLAVAPGRRIEATPGLFFSVIAVKP